MDSTIIENNFKDRSPREERSAMFQFIRAKAKELAIIINEEVPEGREKALAITKLEECVMWVNAGIVRS